MKLQKINALPSGKLVLILLCFCISLSACKFDDPIIDDSAKKDDKKTQIDTDKDTVEKDDDTDGDTDELDEKALSLKELADVWSELDFSKHKIRTQGYVSKSFLYDEKEKCAAVLTFYPFENSQKTLGVKELYVRFKGLYTDKDDCEGLKHQQVSLYIKKALKTDEKEEDIKFLSAESDTELIEAEDAQDKFEGFYTDLIEGEYPDIGVLDYETFKKSKDMEAKLIQTEIKKVVASDSRCTFYFGESEDSPHVSYSFNSKSIKNLSGGELNEGNCSEKALNQFLIADAHIDRKISEKQHFVNSFTFSESKYEQESAKDDEKTSEEESS